MAGETTTSSRFTWHIFYGCVLFLLVGAGAFVVALRVLPPRVIAPDRYWWASASAFFAALALLSLWSIVRGAAKASRSRRGLFRRAEKGEMPVDGEPVVATGSVRATSSLLRSPISGTDCVAYFYQLYFFVPNEEGELAVNTAYWGYACQPFAVDGIERRRIDSVPQLKAKGVVIDGDAARDAAKRYIATTPFESLAGQVVRKLGTAVQQARELVTHENAIARRDWKVADHPDIDALQFEETLLCPGDPVSVVGTWSEMRDAIVAGDGANGVVGVTVVPGTLHDIPPDVVPSRSLGGYLVGIVIEAAIAVGLIVVASRVFYPPGS